MQKERKYIYVICFVISIIVMAVYSVTLLGGFYIESPDGNVYLSIADNFLSTGHFTSTSRPYDVNIVAMPGLPWTLVLLKLICNSNYFIVVVQYLLFAVSNVLIIRAVVNFTSLWRIGLFAWIIYLAYYCTFAVYITPSYILTESYVLFILICMIYIVSKLYIGELAEPKAFSSLLLLSFVGMLYRSILLMIFLLVMLWGVFLIIRKKMSPAQLIKLMIIPFIFITVNGTINYRETGYFVILENYSGIPLYVANNQNTKIEPYNAGILESFVDDYYWEVTNDSTLDIPQKSSLLKEKVKEYVRKNVQKTIIFSLKKFKILFIDNYTYSFQMMILSMIIIFIRKKELRYYCLLGVFVMLAISLPTSCGLVIGRYSIVAIPFYAIYKAALIYFIYELLGGVYKYLCE